jgi:glycosyltransferase involved in cell wall biosynthesis
MPYFSIIIPTYNRAHLIGRTIQSIIEQEFTDFEILVVDDGSSDNTEDAVRQIGDSRIQYFKKQNGERGAARNFGRQKSSGRYINFFDSDDLMYPNHLKVARQVIIEKNNPEIFHLGYDFQTPDGIVQQQVNNLNEEAVRQAMFDNFLSCNGVFLRADIAEQFPFEEDRVLASAEDWELWIRLMCRYKLHFSNEITSSVVSHDQRSIRTIPTDKIIARDLFLIKCLQGDAVVRQSFGNQLNRFTANRFSFFMLCLAEDGRKKEVFLWAARALRIFPFILFSRRFLASLKNTAL